MIVLYNTLDGPKTTVMKNQLSNIALEGTCDGDVAGGLLLWAGANLQALLF